MNKTLNLTSTLLQFLPLTVFTVYSFRTGIPSQERLFQGFMIGAVAALLQVVWLMRQRTPANRLILGVNVWLIAGGIAVYFKLWGVLKMYRELRESGVLACMLGTGIIATVFSPAGFSGSLSGNVPLIFRYSCVLIFLTSLALTCSIYLRGNMFWAAVVPIAVLSIAYRQINIKLAATPGPER